MAGIQPRTSARSPLAASSHAARHPATSNTARNVCSAQPAQFVQWRSQEQGSKCWDRHVGGLLKMLDERALICMHTAGCTCLFFNLWRACTTKTSPRKGTADIMPRDTYNDINVCEYEKQPHLVVGLHLRQCLRLSRCIACDVGPEGVILFYLGRKQRVDVLRVLEHAHNEMTIQ